MSEKLSLICFIPQFCVHCASQSTKLFLLFQIVYRSVLCMQHRVTRIKSRIGKKVVRRKMKSFKEGGMKSEMLTKSVYRECSYFF